MKKKRILSALMCIVFMLCMGSVSVMAADVYDFENMDLPDGASPTGWFNGNSSITSLNSGWTTTITNAGGGKTGKAYQVSATAQTDRDDPYVRYNAPGLSEGEDKVTFEFSAKAPISTYSGRAKVFTLFRLYNSSGTLKQPAYFEINKNGKIQYYDGSTNVEYCDAVPGRWYKFAVSIDLTNKTADLYLNDEHIFTETTFLNSNNITTVSAVNLYFSAVAGTESCDMVYSFDDIRFYKGAYNATSCNTTLTANSEDVFCETDDSVTIYNDERSMNIDTFKSKLTVPEGATFTVYTDSTLSAVETDDVSNGAVVCVQSADGTCVDYYDVTTDLYKKSLIDNDMEWDDFTANSGLEIKNGNLNGRLLYDNMEISSNVTAAQGGRDGRAYVMTLNYSDSTNAKSVYIDFLRTSSENTMTVEFSMRAPQFNVNTWRRLVLSVKLNDGAGDISWEPILMSEVGNNIMVNGYENGRVVGTWIPGHWYHFAVTIHMGSNTADFYINGDKVASEVVSGFENKTISKASRPMFGIVNIAADGETAFSGNIFYDDIKIYEGRYDAREEKATLNTTYKTDSDTIFLSEATAQETFRQNVSCSDSGAEIELYTDSNLATELSENVTGRNMLLLKKGSMIKYYYIENFNTPVIKIDGVRTTEFTSGNVKVAAVSGDATAKIYVAEYVSGILNNVKVFEAEEGKISADLGRISNPFRVFM